MKKKEKKESARTFSHHGSLLDAVARLDDRVLLGGPAQEVGQLAVGALHGVALGPLAAVAAFLLEGAGIRSLVVPR